MSLGGLIKIEFFELYDLNIKSSSDIKNITKNRDFFVVVVASYLKFLNSDEKGIFCRISFFNRLIMYFPSKNDINKELIIFLKRKMKIDLHGLELVEAIIEVSYILEESKHNGDSIIEIVHGFRSGQVLKNYFQSKKFLQASQKDGFRLQKMKSPNKGTTIYKIL